MPTRLSAFENLCRRAHVVDESGGVPQNSHPFSTRNLHPALPKKVRRLFDDGHYSEATFEALKFVDKTVQHIANIAKSGKPLMMEAFGGENPKIALNKRTSLSDQDEQEGFRFIFAGMMSAIRNPKGHEFDIKDGPDTCLDHLTIVSALLRKIEEAGYSLLAK